jgi:hypothetical protein
MWGIGNEMEGYQAGDDPAVWKAVEDIAALAKKLDPNHPTMTVIAELGGARVKSIHELCPHVDIVGINSYGGVASLGERYPKAGGTKPFVVTEFGPPGTWEMREEQLGHPHRTVEHREGRVYRRGLPQGVLGPKDLCLGSYVFLWGVKQEATPTWFGLFLPDGTQLENVHAMASFGATRRRTRLSAYRAAKVSRRAGGAGLRRYARAWTSPILMAIPSTHQMGAAPARSPSEG